MPKVLCWQRVRLLHAQKLDRVLNEVNFQSFLALFIVNILLSFRNPRRFSFSHGTRCIANPPSSWIDSSLIEVVWHSKNTRLLSMKLELRRSLHSKKHGCLNVTKLDLWKEKGQRINHACCFPLNGSFALCVSILRRIQSKHSLQRHSVSQPARCSHQTNTDVQYGEE